MSSRRVEEDHEQRIQELFSKSGLECVRSASESAESTPTFADSEHDDASIEKEIDLKEETVPEEMTVDFNEEQEETPHIFPTPSLRKVLPENIRKIEDFNRIHVLPEKFETHIDPMAIPKIANTPLQICIDILATITGCTEYKRSLAEFWFLDTLANLLRRAQEDHMERSSQAALILWFCEWVKEIQHFDAADRHRMIRRFKDNITSAARFVAEEQRLPSPAGAGVFYEVQEALDAAASKDVDERRKRSVTFAGAEYECSLTDLTRIAHYIFDLFSTDFQYSLVRSIFTFGPEYTLIDPPYQMRVPKTMFSSKTKIKTVKSPKKEKPAKGKKKEIETAEYLALLELRARAEHELEEKENKDREEWSRRWQILALRFAADDEFVNKYWPPPPIEPHPEPQVVGKGKAKGRKKN